MDCCCWYLYCIGQPLNVLEPLLPNYAYYDPFEESVGIASVCATSGIGSGAARSVRTTMAPVQSRFQRGNQRSNGPPRGGTAGASTKLDFFIDQDGDVPWWDGSAKNWADYVTAVQWYVASTKADQRQLCGPRLIRRLRKTAREAVKKLKPSDIAGTD